MSIKPKPLNSVMKGSMETMTKTIQQLRDEFEEMTTNKHFYLDRMKNGEYQKITTFQLWAGYWECAVANKIIVGKDADIKSINK